MTHVIPPATNIRRPAEYERHAKTWMAWPHRRDLYDVELSAMQNAFVETAKAIARFEPVVMVAHPKHAQQAQLQLGNAATVMAAPIDDCWMRDTGPTFVKDGAGALKGVSWNFNAWGEKHEPWDNDAAVAERILDSENVEMLESWLTCEGGSLTTDGEGTLIVAETSVLNHNRNPGVNKALAEMELKAMLGLETVIWLPGDPMDSETDGHIDGMCCFVRPGVVLFERNDDPKDPHSRILAANLAALRQQCDAKGRELEVIFLPEATEAAMTSDIFCASYINFYLPNGGLVMPAYGLPSDDEAKAILAKAFPDREIVAVDVRDIAPGGGAIHCITQEQPAV